MGKITPSTKTNSFAPLGRAIAGTQQGLAIATANNTQYLFNQAGNCVYVQGQDISAVPNAIYTNPVTTSTGLSGPGAAILIGSTWYSFAALTDQTAADIQPIGTVAAAGHKLVPADAEHVHTLPLSVLVGLLVSEVNGSAPSSTTTLKFGTINGSYTTGGLVVAYGTAFALATDACIAVSARSAGTTGYDVSVTAVSASGFTAFYQDAGTQVANGTTTTGYYVAVGH